MNDISDERQFLHDIASPLGTALLLLDLVNKKMGQKSEVHVSDLEQISMATESLEKIRSLISARRNYLSEISQAD